MAHLHWLFMHIPRNGSRSPATRAALFVALVLSLPSTSLAQTGVSADRVSLPEGPGSLEGVGENVMIDPNMGLMRYSVRIETPGGFGYTSPNLSLSYNSGGGASVVGMGWSVDFPAIERMTSRGLPEYDADDLFSVAGGSELVRLPNTDPPVYRARFEGSFSRATWHDSGADGYWVVEYPNGSRGWFGATADGAIVPDSRLAGDDGTFRYHLVELRDPYDHRMVYSWRRVDGVPLLDRIGYVYTTEQPEFEVTFDYEDRDDLQSDCKPGFCEVLTQRLSQIGVMARGATIRRYDLQYEPYADSGGFTRLARVTQTGLEGGQFPIAFRFGYSRALGGQCDGGDCEGPALVEMGSIGVDLQARDATLIDINGDALPDIVDTSQTGAHRFFINQLRVDGHGFSEAVSSGVGTQSSHQLSAGNVQALDIDGDGFSDLLNTRTGEVLRNLGEGDWVESYSLFAGDGGLPSLEADFEAEDGELRTLRFLDYDNDKRIDLLRSEGADVNNTTVVWRNAELGGFELDEGIEAIGAGFESDRLQLEDMNGDGLLDAVLIRPGEVSYRLNLGWGRWGDWVDITGLPFIDSEIPMVEMEDLNNDGLADLVIVVGAEVRYALNRNSDVFDVAQRITGDDVGGSLPERTAAVTVLYADMNGNGSSDVVWIDNNGAVTYLELFPVRPNLLSTIQNGLGVTSTVTYGTSVEHMARDLEEGRPWAYMLPHPMIVVDALDDLVELTGVHEVTRYTYHDAYYDGVEKQFRGYQDVEVLREGDETREAALTFKRFDLGVGDPYRAGRMLRERIEGENGRALVEHTHTYARCPLSGIPTEGLTRPIEFVCKTASESVIMEGMGESAWITTRVEMEYDGYGNVTRDIKRGVTAMGGGACPACDRPEGVTGAPCGAQCLGDEEIAVTSYVEPGESTGGLWILGKPVSRRTYAIEDSDYYAEVLFYYDGEPFVGLPRGQLTHGAFSRMTRRKDLDDAVVEAERVRRNAHGFVVEVIAPIGELDDEAGRLRLSYDDDGLQLVRKERVVEDEGGVYVLRQDVTFDPLWQRPTEVTDWMVVEDGQVTTPRNASSARYDEFGRLVAKTLAGDTTGTPSEVTEWSLGDPVSKVIIRQRNEVGGDYDKVNVRCFDGLGRRFQDRNRVGDGRYVVSGFTIFNRGGKQRALYKPWISDSAECDMAPPEDHPRYTFEHDALDRPTVSLIVDEQGELTTTRRDYRPLQTLQFDGNDTDSGGAFFETPTITDTDGLGRVVRTERLLTAADPGLAYTYTYGPFGNFRGLVDPEGHAKVQTWDAMGRIVRVDDPDRGAITYELDDSDNVLSSTDARGRVTRYRYDVAERRIAEWDPEDEEGTRVAWKYDRGGTCAPEVCTNAANRVVEVTFPMDGAQSVNQTGYDARGGTLTQRLTVAGKAFEFTNALDLRGRLTGVAFPDGRELAFELDPIGRVTAVEGIIPSITYGPMGAVEQVTYANGVTTAIGTDSEGNTTSIVTEGGDGARLFDRSYLYDAEDNLLEIVDHAPDGDAMSGSAVFTYDAFSRLTSAHLDPDNGHQEMMAYSYDALDNITRKISSSAESAAHVGDYTYGGAQPHAVTRAGDRVMAYDDAGHMIVSGQNTLEWDHRGRMTAVRQGDRVLERSFYGPSSSRLMTVREGGARDLYLSPGFEIRNGVATIYVQAGGLRLARSQSLALMPELLSDLAPGTREGDLYTPRPDAVITAADAYAAEQVTGGDAVLADGAPEASPTRALLQASLERMMMGGETRTTYLHTDHLKGTALITDEAGEVVTRTEYYPFGMERRARDRHTTDEAYGHADKEHNTATGMTYYGARFHDPWLGRWVSPDPAFTILTPETLRYPAEEAGAYAYAINSPVTYRDGDGTSVAGKVLTGAVTAVASGIAYAMTASRVTAPKTKQQQQSPEHQMMRGYAIAAGALGGLASGARELITGGAVNPFTALVGLATELAVRRVKDRPNGILAVRSISAVASAGASVGFMAMTGTLSSQSIAGAAALGLTVTGPMFAIGVAVFAGLKILKAVSNRWSLTKRALSATWKGMKAAGRGIARAARATGRGLARLARGLGRGLVRAAGALAKAGQGLALATAGGGLPVPQGRGRAARKKN